MVFVSQRISFLFSSEDFVLLYTLLTFCACDKLTSVSGDAQMFLPWMTLYNQFSIQSFGLVPKCFPKPLYFMKNLSETVPGELMYCWFNLFNCSFFVFKSLK